MASTESLKAVGIEWCSNIASDIEKRIDEITLIEIIPENFFPIAGNIMPRRLAREVERRGIPVMLHSISFSLASLEPLKSDHLARVAAVFDQFPTTIGLSDHLCMTEMHGASIGQLTPAPYDEATLDSVCRKIEAIREVVPLPFALENIAHPFLIPGQPISEPEFMNRVSQRTGASILLDLHNLHTNAINFSVDPLEWIANIDLARVEAIHLAGGYYDGDNFLQDGHCARVPDPVWSLYEQVARRAKRRIPTIVERTGRNEGGLEPILDDQRKAAHVLDEVLS